MPTLSYLDQARQEVAARIPNGFGTADQVQSRLQQGWGAGVTTPTGYAPRQSDFLQVQTRVTSKGGIVNEPGMFGRSRIEPTRRSYDYTYDANGYQSALAGWMKSSGRYKDWTDQDIQAFAAETADMTPEQRSARELQENNRIAWDKANEEAKADRTRMLGELEAFKANYGEARINEAMSREKSYWDARNTQILDRAQKQMANMGRVASPWLLEQLGKRLTAQADEALAVRRFDYERENQQQQQFYLTQLNGVLANTKRNVMDPVTAATMTKQAGSAAAA